MSLDDNKIKWQNDIKNNNQIISAFDMNLVTLGVTNGKFSAHLDLFWRGLCEDNGKW